VAVGSIVGIALGTRRTGDDVRYRFAVGQVLAWNGTVQVSGQATETGRDQPIPLGLTATFHMEARVVADDASGSTLDTQLTQFQIRMGDEPVAGVPPEYRFTLRLDPSGGVVSSGAEVAQAPTAFNLRIEDLLALGLVPIPRDDLRVQDTWRYGADVAAFGRTEPRRVDLAARYDGGGAVVAIARAPFTAAQRDRGDTLRFAADEQIDVQLTIADGRPNRIFVRRTSVGREEAVQGTRRSEVRSSAALEFLLEPVG
jgi:hypothetical protein